MESHIIFISLGYFHLKGKTLALYVSHVGKCSLRITIVGLGIIFRDSVILPIKFGQRAKLSISKFQGLSSNISSWVSPWKERFAALNSRHSGLTIKSIT